MRVPSIFLYLFLCLLATKDVFANEWISRDIAGKSRMTEQGDKNERVLKIDADCSASGFFKKEYMDASSHPRLSWRWRISNALAGSDERAEPTDDSAARLLIFFDAPPPKENFFSGLRYRLATSASGGVLPDGPAIAYAWSETLAPETAIQSPFTERVKIIVLRGPEDAGKIGSWSFEERDPVRDFKDVFGVEPKGILGFAVMADTDQTCQAVTTSFSDVRMSV